MSLPRAKLRTWASGRHTLEPPAITATEVLASADQQLLVPVFEVLSNGEPPVAPMLVQEASRGWRVRSVRCRSGELVRSPMQTKPRGQFVVGWESLTREQHEQLVEFFGPAGTAGGRFGFDIRPDGPGSDPITVRLLEPIVHEWVASHVYRIPPVRVEELYG